MPYTYYLPDEQNRKITCETENNAVVIIGANGAGKSHLGAWMEQQNLQEIHRIGAQRKLNFNENITLKSYSEAEDLVFYGYTGSGTYKLSKGQRWNDGKSYTTQLLDDFENILAALIALENNENRLFAEECKQAELNRKLHPPAPKTVTDKLLGIWNEVFPQRQLRLKDSKFYAVLNQNGKEIEYPATQMSDGERSVLYFAAQILCVPQGKTLIMDEPELHLHRSLMNRLWIALEAARKDCLFIYITHDTQFATRHSHADKIWVQEYNGSHWKLQKIENSDLPEELLLDLMGNRKNVIFVEGDKNSYDTQLYSAIYRDYYVVPCGSCTQVIARTKAFKQNPLLHHCQVYGIIDRDYRSEYEISKYKECGIFTIDVAEVENLFLVEGLVRAVAEHQALNADEVFSKVKKYVIKDRFEKQMEKQICQSVVSQIKYQLNTAEISKKSETEARTSLEAALKAIDFDAIKTEQEKKFNDVKDSGSYADVLCVFNEKNLLPSVGRFFGLPNNAYCCLVLRLLSTPYRDTIINALLPYTPTELS